MILSASKQSATEQKIAYWLAQPLLWLGPLLLIGFGLRLAFALGSVYHFDEFITMLAVKMVTQRGLPILPSGLFYDHGLLLSLISGAWVALLGFSEELARWPVVLASTLTIAVYYIAGQRLFNSRLTGLLAAALAAFDELSVVWGGRARMYSLAHLFVLLSLAWLLESTLKQPSSRQRYLFLAFLMAALFSHTISFLIVPALAILLFVFTLLYRREWLYQPRLWQEVLVGLVALGLVFIIVKAGQVDTINAVQDPLAQAPPPLGLEFLRGFFLPGLEWTRFDNLVGFFETPAYGWLRPLIGLSLLATLYQLVRRRATFADVAFLFILLFLALVVFEMGALLTDTWSKSRYLFILTLPAFLLLSAESLARPLRWLVYLTARINPTGPQPGWLAALLPLPGLLLIISMWGPTTWGMAHLRGTGDYDTAFAFVREQWQAGDKVMTVHPSAAFLYLDRCDYFANQVSAAVLNEANDQDDLSLVDRFTGSPLIDSVEALNAVLAKEQRLWFVVDETRLYERYEPFFTQQILAQMELVHRTGSTYVFLSRPHPIPLPAEPLVKLDANFGGAIQLAGYSLNLAAPAPDGTTSLGLYWRPTGTPARQLKVFVQLRNGQGETIAQADHFLLQGLLTFEVWNRLLQQGEWLRDATNLRLPLPLSPAGEPYRLYVGFYDPTTLERVPILNDTSGENAVVIDLPSSLSVALE